MEVQKNQTEAEEDHKMEAEDEPKEAEENQMDVDPPTSPVSMKRKRLNDSPVVENGIMPNGLPEANGEVHGEKEAEHEELQSEEMASEKNSSCEIGDDEKKEIPQSENEKINNSDESVHSELEKINDDSHNSESLNSVITKPGDEASLITDSENDNGGADIKDFGALSKVSKFEMADTKKEIEMEVSDVKEEGPSATNETSDLISKEKTANTETKNANPSEKSDENDRAEHSSSESDKTKENGENVVDLDCEEITEEKKSDMVNKESGPEKPSLCDEDSNNDDIQIVGESKVVNVSTPFNSNSSHNIVFVPSNSAPNMTSLLNRGFSATNLLNATMSHAGLGASLLPGQGIRGMPALPPGLVLAAGGVTNQNPNLSNMMATSLAPPKPKSSLDQIELIRWEIYNRVNTRPKYFKPNASSELGPLSKFLYDIGSDLIKESVYHELVKIQSKKNDDDKLTEKEKDDLGKLKEIEKDLHATIGHLKLKLRKRCRTCQFQTESLNVLYLHKQYPHEESKILHCAHCKYSSKQAVSFKFHLESEHNMQPRLYDKKAFFECDMCPYENNQEQKVNLHKQRCIKQFRPHFNLHPSCLSGAEINLCLENIFYKPIIPKNLKILQQKHAQQQSALAEARRQQAQVQALAVQKNASTALKKQQQHLQEKQRIQQLQRLPLPLVPRQLPLLQANRMPVAPPRPITPRATQRATPKQTRKEPAKSGKPTVANMLNNRANIPPPGASPKQPPAGAAGSPKGFEVCELCGGYVKDRKALRIHFFYAHRIDLPFNLFERHLAPLYCATCYIRFWTAQGLRKHIDTHKEENQTTGVVGKCISCGHHVLNLVLHMRIVHNREMQHYINALMCMFCPSNFTSKDQVEKHIKTVHGTIDPVTGVIKNTASHQNSPRQASKGSSKRSGNAPPVKGSVCVLCNLNFGRNVDLTRHCMKMHHTCMKCGMVVIDKASLLKHTCLSSPSGIRDCTMCEEKGFHPAYFVKHLRDKHLKKFSIRVARLSKKTIEKWTKVPFQTVEPESVLVEISDSSDDESKNEPMVKAVSPAKKMRIGPASVMRKFKENDKNKDSDAEKVIDLSDASDSKPEDFEEPKKESNLDKGKEKNHVENVVEGKDVKNAEDGKDGKNAEEGKDGKNVEEEKDVEMVDEGKDVEKVDEGKDVENVDDGKDVQKEDERKDVEKEDERKDVEKEDERKDVEKEDEEKDVEEEQEESCVEESGSKKRKADESSPERSSKRKRS